MPNSSMTLATCEARVGRVLFDTLGTVWGTAQIDEGIRSALGEYNSVRPLEAIGTLTAIDGPEQALTPLGASLLDVLEVWTPYTAAAPEIPPNVRSYHLLKNQTAWSVWLDDWSAAAGDVVRVFYTLPNVMNGLDGGASSTFPAEADDLLVTGAAGYALYQRSIDLNETAGQMAVSTPNYGTLAEIYLGDFRARLWNRGPQGAMIYAPSMSLRDRRGR